MSGVILLRLRKPVRPNITSPTLLIIWWLEGRQILLENCDKLRELSKIKNTHFLNGLIMIFPILTNSYATSAAEIYRSWGGNLEFETFQPGRI